MGCKSPSDSVENLEDLKADCAKKNLTPSCCTRRSIAAPQLCRKASD